MLGELLVIGVATLLYLYLKRVYSYWDRMGVAQAPPIPLCGNLLPALLNRTNVGLIYDRIYRKYSGHEAVGVYSLLTPKLLLRSPQLVQRVLVSDFSSFHDNEFTVNKNLEPVFALDPFCIKGEEWKKVRARLSSLLMEARVKEIFLLMRDLVYRVDEYLDKRSGEDIEAKELSSLFTMDLVSDCVFGVASDCFSDPEAVFRKMAAAQKVDVMQSWWRTLVLTVMPGVRDFLGLKFVPTSVTEFIEKVVLEVSEVRMTGGIIRNDFFHHFIKKADGSEDPLQEMLSMGLSFFVDGFETASLVASRVLYELALNPGVQQTLREELEGALGPHPHYLPQYETLAHLPYLDHVVSEAQRKYPVLMTFSRVCNRRAELAVDGKTVTIQPGTTVIVPVFSIHRDPQYFPNPEQFDPDRFNKNTSESRPACSFMPFGEGPRICPGVKFGLVQVKLLVSNIVRKYNILPSPETPQKLTFASGAFLVVPNEKLWIRTERRK